MLNNRGTNQEKYKKKKYKKEPKKSKRGEEEGDAEEGECQRNRDEEENGKGELKMQVGKRGLDERDEGVVTHVARDGRVLIRAECIYEHARIRRTCARGSFNG